MDDPAAGLPSQGGCALLPHDPAACGNGGGSGMTTAQRALPANYAYNVTRLQQLEAMNGSSKPIVVPVETGCPYTNGLCTSPAESTASAWHAIIAGARGIVWFQHNFSGPCISDRTFIDGSNPATPTHGCQYLPGITVNGMVKAITAFNKKVISLNNVLLAPTAEGYVSTGRADVATMAKYSGGSYYIFAGSGRPATPPSANQSVTFTVTGGHTGPVTVVGENRTLHGVNGRFTDTFADENAVHIYKIG